MIRFRVNVDMGTTMEKLDEMQARSEDFRITFEYARLLLSRANAENFTTGGLPVGGWRPRAQAAEWPIMRKTGHLMESLIDLRGVPNEIRPKSATFGTAVDYAGFHQTGTTRMASRKIVFEPRGFAREVGEHAIHHILGMGSYFSR